MQAADVRLIFLSPARSDPPLAGQSHGARSRKATINMLQTRSLVILLGCLYSCVVVHGFPLLDPRFIPSSRAGCCRTASSPTLSLSRSRAARPPHLQHCNHFGRKTRILSKPTSDTDDEREKASALSLASELTKSIVIATGDPTRSAFFTILMAVSGAVLGPFLDSYHSAFGVLQYHYPITATLWGSETQPALITTSWVPFLFGLAGLLIGWLYILLDEWPIASKETQARQPVPSPPKILIGISIFTFQYWLSGILYQSGVDRTTILNVMSVVAGIGFYVLDGSWAGFLVSSATAIGGPLIEVGLLSLSRNDFMLLGQGYHYTDPGETGFFPLWIVPVYFLGGPAVGNLARGVWQALSQDEPPFDFHQKGKDPLPGCTVCNDTRRVPCPNCDGVGTYVAMGGRSVTCTSCHGRGFVVCRACFSFYDEEPNDIEAIRDMMSRMPD